MSEEDEKVEDNKCQCKYVPPKNEDANLLSALGFMALFVFISFAMFNAGSMTKSMDLRKGGMPIEAYKQVKICEADLARNMHCVPIYSAKAVENDNVKD